MTNTRPHDCTFAPWCPCGISMASMAPPTCTHGRALLTTALPEVIISNQQLRPRVRCLCRRVDQAHSRPLSFTLLLSPFCLQLEVSKLRTAWGYSIDRFTSNIKYVNKKLVISLPVCLKACSWMKLWLCLVIKHLLDAAALLC